MKTAVVISLDLPNPEQITTVLDAINPPSIPHFAGEVRVVIGTDVDDLVKWLDEPD